MPKKEHEEPFFQRLAALMVRSGRNLWQAANDLSLGLSSEECAELSKNEAFQRILRTERMKVYNELANNPQRTKSTLIGQAVLCIERLIEEEQYEKAINGLVNLAKIEGWVGSDTNVNVFANLTQKDIAEIKQKLKQNGELPAGNA